MAYDSSNLSPTDLTGLDWAIAWTRFLLKDTDADNELFSDTELQAVIEAMRFDVEEDGVTTSYYRPHVAAAHLITTDPDRAVTESLLGSSVTTQSPGSVARAIRASGRWIDDAIYTASEQRPPTGRTLRAVF